METNITISISNLGKAVGTLGWVSEALKNASVKICPSKKGRLCAFLHYTDPRTSKEEVQSIAMVCNSVEDCNKSELNSGYGYSRYKNGIEYAYASDGECYFSEGRWCVFNAILTDAATTKVEELVSDVVAKLRAAWEGN